MYVCMYHTYIYLLSPVISHIPHSRTPGQFSRADLAVGVVDMRDKLYYARLIRQLRSVLLLAHELEHLCMHTCLNASMRLV
jgi:hypothetical protein